MYSPTGNAIRPRGISGFLTCDVNGSNSDFRLVNKVSVYPGRENNWLVAKSAAGSGTIEDFVSKFIVKPFTTSFGKTNVVYGVQAIGTSAQDAKLYMQATGLRMQANASGNVLSIKDQNPKVTMGAAPVEYFQISFYIPEDYSGTNTPWPVDGCVEEAGWTLSAATSDIQVVNGAQVPLAKDLVAGRAAASGDASSKARKDAMARLMELSAKKSATSYLSNKWVWAGGAAGLAALMLVWRAKAHR